MERRPEPDGSGTPRAMLELLERSGRLVVLDALDDGEVLIEFPFAAAVRAETGCSRFVRLRTPIEGATHALVR